jgi:CBS-domain-containing membrane protein
MALAVGLAIAVMQWTKTVHPPAGADPLVVMLSGAGWPFLLSPVLLGSLFVVTVAWAYHRLSRTPYPRRWL